MTIDILQISSDARQAKRHFNDVIDGSVGMYIDEQGYVGGLAVVFEAYKKMNPLQSIPYPAVDGGLLFKENIFAWAFQQYASLIKDNFSSFVCATPGGSGAISMVFRTQVPLNEKVLVSDIRWQYDRFADASGIKLHIHRLFDGDKFNLADFEQQFIYLCSIQKKVVVVINDPCQNPSGYTLSLDEWETILTILNTASNNEVILLYDIAYIDYSSEIDAREKTSKLINLKNHVHVMVTFSGSKTFGAYGLRLGALIALSRNEAWLKQAKTQAINMARGTWSATPTPAIELLNEMMIPAHKPQFLEGLKVAKQTIIARGQLFLKEANEVGLALVPYVNGFYVIVKCNHPFESYQKLASKRLFFVPMEQGLRIALCSLTLKEIKGLAARLKLLIF